MALVAAGVIFSLVAISHFIRALYAVEVLMVGKIVPIVVSPFLCIFAVRIAGATTNEPNAAISLSENMVSPTVIIRRQ